MISFQLVNLTLLVDKLDNQKYKENQTAEDGLLKKKELDEFASNVNILYFKELAKMNIKKKKK